MKRFLVIFSLLSMACLSTIVPATLTPAPTQTLTKTPAPTITATRTQMITKTPESGYMSIGKVYIRDMDGEQHGYLETGEMVICHLVSSGWCLMDYGNKVWGGCLVPNPLGLGCEAK